MCQNDASASGVHSFVAPGPWARLPAAQGAQPIHPVSECHLRVRPGPGWDAASAPRTRALGVRASGLRSPSQCSRRADSHTILSPTRLGSAPDSHRSAPDSHPIRTQIALVGPALAESAPSHTDWQSNRAAPSRRIPATPAPAARAELRLQAVRRVALASPLALASQPGSGGSGGCQCEAAALTD